MVFIVAQIEAPRLAPTQGPGIQAPSSVRPSGSGRVGAPGFGSQQILPTGKRESIDDRTRRLQEAGVLPTPTPTPDSRPKIATEFSKLQQSATRQDGRIMPVENRFQANIASWFGLVKPKQTTVTPDLSYGFVYLRAFSNEPLLTQTWNRQNFWGVGLASYNGGTIVRFDDELGDETQTYADTNVTEVGAEFTQSVQKPTDGGGVWGFESTQRVYPLRFIRSRYRSTLTPPADSEITQRMHFNYFGLGLGGNVFYSFAQIFKLGFFTDVNMAAPFQLRARVGLLFEMSHRLDDKTPPQPAMAPVPVPTPAPTPAPRTLQTEGK